MAVQTKTSHEGYIGLFKWNTKPFLFDPQGPELLSLFKNGSTQKNHMFYIGLYS